MSLYNKIDQGLVIRCCSARHYDACIKSQLRRLFLLLREGGREEELESPKCESFNYYQLYRHPSARESRNYRREERIFISRSDESLYN